ncbi:DUF1799 domain-containing protein [Salinicola sp. CPA57]|uniref:DUF1799 domain-containing protein n=1 Tax=Salinicola sp. CPA57 TaxID=1949080 RepID=UPI000DA1FE4E|nr:DUF1799 domain-containing protein [Salinicola sp. CPA57]
MERSPARRARGSGKKLNALGRAWAGQSGGKNELRSDLDAWGVTVPARYLEPERIVIWPKHVTAWSVFSQCSGQWRYITGLNAKPVAQGIDRTALASVMQMMGVEDQATALRQVQHIEAGALEVMRQR